MLNRNLRDRINKIYEPELIRIERQRAFLRTFDFNSFNDTDNLSQKLLGKRSSLATSKSVMSIRPSLLSRKFSTDPNRHSSMSRSIKGLNNCFEDISSKLDFTFIVYFLEFSYFDWSKVKLHTDDYLSNNANNTNNTDSRTLLNGSNATFTNNNTTSLAALSNYSNETNSHTNNSSNNNNSNKHELQPQVITIRYT